MKISKQTFFQLLGPDTKYHIGMRRGSRWSISTIGLAEAALHIFHWGGRIALVLVLSLIFPLLFCYIRGLIQGYVSQSYKSYVIWFDTSVFGLLPSMWIQQHCRNEILDIFMRGIWFSYAYVLLFGTSVIFIFRGQVQRHILSVVFTLSCGLLIHYLIPTQPPWMAVNGVIRVTGDHLSSLDTNPVAAMPSIHQAIICLAGCALWQYGTFGKVISISYNFGMAICLVYLGEHFLADCVAGVVIAIASWFCAGHILLKYKQRYGRNVGGLSSVSHPRPRLAR